MSFIRGLFDRRMADARRALDERRLDDAERLLKEILRDRPDSAPAWWDLGLVYKSRKQWPESLEAFVRNAELRPAPEPYWNAAIAATALRDWATARWAWQRLEFDVGPGEGPPDADFGPAPVRLNPDDAGEVIWGKRIDPCRVRVVSVPLPESGHRFGDVVLHDVVPRGSRMLQGVELGVFDELERMDPSPHPTLKAELSWVDPADEAALYEAFVDPDLGAENWTSNIDLICATCSLSRAHVHERDDEVRLTGTWGFGGDHGGIKSIVDAWSRAGAGRIASNLEVAES